jgi:hypothetical protein
MRPLRLKIPFVDKRREFTQMSNMGFVYIGSIVVLSLVILVSKLVLLIP